MVRSQLAELKALRAQGKTRAATYKVEEDADIYDEVDQNEYSKALRARMAEDDFVVDDNGGDYVDNGAYDWDTPMYSSDEEASSGVRKKHKSGKAAKSDEKRDGAVSSLFRKAAKPQATMQKPVVRDQSAIDDIINGLTPDSTKFKSRSGAKRPLGGAANTPLRDARHTGASNNITPTPAQRTFPKMAKLPSSPPAHAIDLSEDLQAAPGEGLKLESDDELSTVPPHSPLLEAESDAEEAPVRLVAAPHVEQPLPPISTSTPVPSSEADFEIAQKLVAASSEDAEMVTELSSDAEVVKFFWMDYCELNNNFVLFGRTSENQSVSVAISDMHRPVYFLPAEGSSHLNVVEEVADTLASFNICEFRSRKVSKKYCFGLPGVPAEADYFCLYLPFNVPRELPEKLATGKSYSHVFGLGGSMFETFVVSQNVMGPCWLDVKNFKSSGDSTWARKNVQASGMASVVVAEEQPPMPAVTVMSLSLRTRITETNLEIVAISARFYRQMDVDRVKKASDHPVVSLTCVRPLEKVFPLDFKSEVEAFHKKLGVNTITCVSTESAMLSWFVAQVHRFDPDVVVGHDLESVQLNVLFSRLRDLKVQFWSKLGRMKRSYWPSRIDDFSVRSLMSGRLVADLSNDQGRSLVSGCTEWSLTEMAQVVLKTSRIDMSTDIERSNWSKEGSSGLLKILRHNDGDAALVMEICLATQAIPLTRQLTNLAGNAWSRTMAGSRADRNNFLLLHEFTREGYIVPDKAKSRGDGTRGKAKYAGGKVFDPVKGLYRSNVLVMDFNSLYPSIIQEFNICFTTINCANCQNPDDPLPPLPSANVEMGIFPRLIKNLVDRRRTVKNLIKSSSNATEEELAQWEIRQIALKLTANSMYGCLGYAQSRFYALPLARLTTQQGREILGQTKSLAENEGLKVIYGDTDSVMISTGVYSDQEARLIGESFKKAVNSQYRMLEIDIDNVFGSMLLNAKKKYAATEVIKHGDKTETKLVVKGLDLRRREFCKLSKDASMFALEQLLNDADIDEALSRIHQYLEKLAADVRGNRIPLPMYLIHSQLGKNPQDYTESHKPAHVHVALRRQARGELVRANDVIAFVVTAPLPNETNVSAAERARSLTDMRAEQRTIDVEYYLQQQILTVIGRICENVEAADIGKLALCLGLEPPRSGSRHKDTSSSAMAFVPFESQLSDAERFKDCQPLKLVCPDCMHETVYRGVEKDVLTPRGIVCTGCKVPITGLRLNAQLEMLIRGHIARYYEGWLKCNDAACGLVTRQISGAGGKRCFGKEGTCRGTLHFMYSSRDLHNQLMFFEAMFDMERMSKTLKDNGELRELAVINQDRFTSPRGVAAKYLRNNGRQYVDMKRLFNFM